MTDRTELTNAQAQLILGRANPETLLTVAAAALEAGWDSPSLRVVAGLRSSELAEAPELFGSALVELGIPPLEKRDAVVLLARDAARAVLLRQIPPIDAARLIWDLSLALDESEALPELDSFIYGASEWDDRPEDRGDLAAGIVDAARDILDAA